MNETYAHFMRCKKTTEFDNKQKSSIYLVWNKQKFQFY